MIVLKWWKAYREYCKQVQKKDSEYQTDFDDLCVDCGYEWFDQSFSKIAVEPPENMRVKIESCKDNKSIRIILTND